MILRTDEASGIERSTRASRLWVLRCVQAASVSLLLLVIIGMLGRPAWIGDLAAHFFVQYTLAAGLLLIIAAWRRRWAMMVALGACLLISGWSALAPFRNASTIDASRVTVQSVRMLYANVRSRNKTPRAVGELVRRDHPDVIVLVEASERFRVVIDELATAYPHSVVDLRENNDGLAILSRLPMQDAEIIKLGPSRCRAAAGRIVVGDGRGVSVRGVHVHPPLTPSGRAQRDAELADIAKHVIDIHEPVILVGDLNTTMWAPSFKDMLTTSQLNDARNGQGILATWPVIMPGLLRLPIDQCLHSRDIVVREMRVGDAIGSDHLPLIVDFILR